MRIKKKKKAKFSIFCLLSNFFDDFYGIVSATSDVLCFLEISVKFPNFSNHVSNGRVHVEEKGKGQKDYEWRLLNLLTVEDCNSTLKLATSLLLPFLNKTCKTRTPWQTQHTLLFILPELPSRVFPAAQVLSRVPTKLYVHTKCYHIFSSSHLIIKCYPIPHLRY